MDETFESALNKLGFTQYESQALIALIKFKNLDAPGITQNSGVPQPKVYEIMEKLLSRGLIDKIPLGRKSIYEIKPRSLLEKKIGEIMQEYSSNGQFVLSSINSNYGTEQGSEIPFVGVAGIENITQQLSYAIDDARESIISFMPRYLIQESVEDSLIKASKRIQVAIICREENHAQELAEQIPNAEVSVLETPAFDIIRQLGEKIKSFLPPQDYESFAFNVIQNLLQNFSEIFGLSVFDQRKSFFLVPIPLGVPMAIITTLPEMLRFHAEGINAILKSSRQIN